MFILVFGIIFDFTSCSDDITSSNSSSTSNIESVLKNYGWKSDIQYDHLLYGSGDDVEFSWDRETSTYFFLDNEMGYCRTFRHSEDTYFGSKNKTITSEFYYRVENDKVNINGTLYTLIGDNLIQQNTSTPSYLKKVAITSDDRKFIELAPYTLLTGFERVGFPIGIKCEPHGLGSIKKGNVIFYPLDVTISLFEKDHIFTRGVTDIELTFTVKENTGNLLATKNIVETHVFVNADEDITKVEDLLLHVSGDNPVIQVRARGWDPIERKYLDNYDLDECEFQITKPDYIRQLESDQNAENSAAYDIIGTWRTPTKDNEYLKLEFNKNGIVKYFVYYKGELNYDVDYNYVYDKEKGRITISDEYDSAVWTVKFLSEKSMKITMFGNEYTFTKQ